MNRNLDGIYFRIKRNGQCEKVCFSDLTIKEQHKILNELEIERIASLCVHLAERLKRIGDLFNLIGKDDCYFYTSCYETLSRKTNYQRIKSMSINEMAEFFDFELSCGMCGGVSAWKEWLNEN